MWLFVVNKINEVLLFLSLIHAHACTHTPTHTHIYIYIYIYIKQLAYYDVPQRWSQEVWYLTVCSMWIKITFEAMYQF